MNTEESKIVEPREDQEFSMEAQNNNLAINLSDLSVNITEVEPRPLGPELLINENLLSRSKLDYVDSSEEEQNVLKDLVNSIQPP